MSTGRRTFHSLKFERDHLDPSTRRTIRYDEPKIVLRVATAAGTLQPVELSRDEFAKLLVQAAPIAAELVDGKRTR